MAKVNNFSVLMGGVVTALTTVSIEDQFSIGHDVDYDEKNAHQIYSKISTS